MEDQLQVATKNVLSGRELTELVTQSDNTPPDSLPHPSPVKYPKRVTRNAFISSQETLHPPHQPELRISTLNTIISPPPTAFSDHGSPAKPHGLKIRKVVHVTRQGRKSHGSATEVLIDVPIQLISSQEFLGGRKRQLDETKVHISAGAGKLPR